MTIAYPSQTLLPELNERVTYKVVTVANPAVGTDFSKTVPAGKIWEILALYFTYTTSAVAATRTPRITFDDGTTTFAEVKATASVTASTVSRHTWGKRQSGTSFAADATGTAMPEFILNAGSRLNSTIYLLQAADQISNIVLYVREIDIS